MTAFRATILLFRALAPGRLVDLDVRAFRAQDARASASYGQSGASERRTPTLLRPIASRPAPPSGSSHPAAFDPARRPWWSRPRGVPPGKVDPMLFRVAGAFRFGAAAVAVLVLAGSRAEADPLYSVTDLGRTLPVGINAP